MALASDCQTWPPPSAIALALAADRAHRAAPPATTDVELVARLLGRDEPAPLLTAERLLAGRGLRGLIPLRPLELRHLGASAAGAASLADAFELARRLAAAPYQQRPVTLSAPQHLAHYLTLHHAPSGQEIMGALYLDVRHRLIADREIFRGRLAHAAVEPLPLLKEALLLDAAGLMLYHNHPSGDPTPSLEDHIWTRRMQDALGLLGIELVDHIIVTYQGGWTSLRRSDAW
jgi:DNA repair protein RadC